MQKDRFLQGILLFILVLVVAALGSFFLFQRNQDYLPETSPENVARNYVLALQKKEFEKAYTYLQKTDNTPTFPKFQESLIKQRPLLSDTGVRIVDISRSGDQAFLEIILIHGGGEPFGRTWREEDTGLLVRDNQEWKISHFPHPYWGWNWESPPRPKPVE